MRMPVARYRVDAIEATAAALSALGAKFRRRPAKGPGSAQVLVADPSGKPIELFEPRARAE